jgi:hypothetical protein
MDGADRGDVGAGVDRCCDILSMTWSLTWHIRRGKVVVIVWIGGRE